MPTKLNSEILGAAIEGFEAQKRRIDDQIRELRARLSGGSVEPAAMPQALGRGRKKFSAASRRKMALAQKARWAKIRGASGPSTPATPKPAKPKRRISEEGMKRIIAAAKKRWRSAKAAKAQPATAKKAAVKKEAAATAASVQTAAV
jgi:hypothetical protein